MPSARRSFRGEQSRVLSPNGRGGWTPLRPLRGLQETRVVGGRWDGGESPAPSKYPPTPVTEAPAHWKQGWGPAHLDCNEHGQESIREDEFPAPGPRDSMSLRLLVDRPALHRPRRRGRRVPAAPAAFAVSQEEHPERLGRDADDGRGVGCGNGAHAPG